MLYTKMYKQGKSYAEKHKQKVKQNVKLFNSCNKIIYTYERNISNVLTFQC